MSTIQAIFLGGAPLFALALLGIFVYFNRDKFAKGNDKKPRG